MTTPAAVVFDLDGTLCEGTQVEGSLYEAAFAATDVEPFGSPGELWAALDGPPEPDPEDERSSLAAGFRRVGAQHGRRGVPADALAAGLIDAVDYSAVAYRAGAEAALAAAREHGPVAVMTNGPARRQRPKVRTLGLDERVDAVVYAGDMERRKPHPEPFARVCRAIETPPETTLYVGDSLENDVAGAHGAGLRAAWCPQAERDPGQYRPEHVFDGPADLDGVV
ncbi:HAD family hydrolase [Halomicrobium sp. LC1Hm]|uniref:HAD family hydrolase n=1 Tax=Halomicrobium sp. LC1Hm TaxID=2610902 RepID=UPI0012983615|nr:HAD family hydrolase [Halomicrobium sp. LC1Hm]QGA83433.1 HAD superfamily hydrolase [Halomicrobium sp. LC1Hm]